MSGGPDTGPGSSCIPRSPPPLTKAPSPRRSAHWPRVPASRAPPPAEHPRLPSVPASPPATVSSARRSRAVPSPRPRARGNPRIGGSGSPGWLRRVSRVPGSLVEDQLGMGRYLGHTLAWRAAPPTRPGATPQILAGGGGREPLSFTTVPSFWLPRGLLSPTFRFIFFYTHFPTFRLVSPITRTPASGPLSWPAYFFVCSGCRLTSVQMFVATS